jgi:chitin synthase
MLVFTGVTISFFITSTTFTFAGISSDTLGILVTTLMSAIGGILLTALLHGDLMPVLCSGFQYWVMQPVFYNMLQVNAFCNADDISWGTKNLDKSGTHEAVKTQSKKLAYRVRPTQTSRAFWKAMGDLQSHLLDENQVKIYNARKEAKLRAFASYLLIAWVGSNVILAAVIGMISNYSWEVCAVTESEMAVSAIRSQADDYDKALAIADLVQTAVTILQRGEQLYPFNGLQGFPQAYPMLVSGDAQSDTDRGSRVTVLANATEMFNNLDQSMPKFDEWLAQAMGINASATLDEFNQIWLPMPSNTTGFDTSITCTKEYGYKYYLQAQFLLLMFIILFQVGGSIIFIVGTWWRWFSAAAFGAGKPGPLPPGQDPDGKILDTDDEDDGSDFEVAIQPSNARYIASQRRVPSSDDIDSATDSGSYTPTSDGSGHGGMRRRGGSPRYVD